MTKFYDLGSSNMSQLNKYLFYILCCLSIVPFCQGQDTLKIKSGDHTIYGQYYRGNGQQPMPSLLLLHGFPGGYGDVLELGQNLSQDGINVFTLTLSGISISEGVYADSSPVIDVQHAVNHLLSPENISRY